MGIIHIVGHTDVDGLASHTILDKYYKAAGKEVKHYFVNYQNAKETISKLEFNEGDYMVLADLGYSEETFGSLLNKFEKYFSWYDHHDWAADALADISKLADELIVNKDLCASEIVKNKFLPEDTVANKLAELARAHDFGGKDSKKETYDLACKLQDVITSGYDKMMVMESLSEGCFWNDEFKRAYQDYRIRRDNAIGEMKETITSFEIASETTVSIAAVPDALESKDVRKYLLENTKSDVVIGWWPTTGRVAYEVRDEAHVPFLKKMWQTFKGRGRDFAGGGTWKVHADKNYKQHFEEMAGLLG